MSVRSFVRDRFSLLFSPPRRAQRKQRLSGMIDALEDRIVLDAALSGLAAELGKYENAIANGQSDELAAIVSEETLNTVTAGRVAALRDLLTSANSGIDNSNVTSFSDTASIQNELNRVLAGTGITAVVTKLTDEAANSDDYEIEFLGSFSEQVGFDLRLEEGATLADGEVGAIDSSGTPVSLTYDWSLKVRVTLSAAALSLQDGVTDDVQLQSLTVAINDDMLLGEGRLGITRATFTANSTANPALTEKVGLTGGSYTVNVAVNAGNVTVTTTDLDGTATLSMSAVASFLPDEVTQLAQNISGLALDFGVGANILFDVELTEANPGDESRFEVQQIAFRDVDFDYGPLITPIIRNLQAQFAPFREAINFLYGPIQALQDAFDELGIRQKAPTVFSVLKTLATAKGRQTFYNKLEKTLEFMDAVLKYNGVNTSAPKQVLGNFTTNGMRGNVQPAGNNDQPNKEELRRKIREGVGLQRPQDDISQETGQEELPGSSVSVAKTGGVNFDFPFLDDSEDVLRVILGENGIDLFTADLKFGLGITGEIPFFKTLFVELGFLVTAGVDINLGIGLQTNPQLTGFLRDFDPAALTTGTQTEQDQLLEDLGKAVLAGVFIDDHHPDGGNAEGFGVADDGKEAVISIGLGLSATVGLDGEVLGATIGVAGTLNFNLEFDLRDLPTNLLTPADQIPANAPRYDGKITLEEFGLMRDYDAENRLSPPRTSVVNSTGSLSLKIDAVAKAFLGPFEVTEILPIVNRPLFNWNFNSITENDIIEFYNQQPDSELTTAWLAVNGNAMTLDLSQREEFRANTLTFRNEGGNLVVRNEKGRLLNTPALSISNSTQIVVTGTDRVENITIEDLGVPVNVQFFGGAGDDIFTYSGTGNVLADGGAGADQLTSDRGMDTLIGGLGIDVLESGAGNDVLIGGVSLSDNSQYFPRTEEERAKLRIPVDPSLNLDLISGDFFDSGEGNDSVYGTEGVDLYTWRVEEGGAETIVDAGTGAFDRVIVEGGLAADHYQLTATGTGANAVAQLNTTLNGNSAGTLHLQGVEQLEIRMDDLNTQFTAAPGVSQSFVDSGLQEVSVVLPDYGPPRDVDGNPTGNPPARNGSHLFELPLSDQNDQLLVDGIAGMENNRTYLVGEVPFNLFIENSVASLDRLRISGGGGADTIEVNTRALQNIGVTIAGDAGDDVLSVVNPSNLTGEFPVILEGGANDDTLTTSVGGQLLGGSGNDTYVLLANSNGATAFIEEDNNAPEADTLDLTDLTTTATVDLSLLNVAQTIAAGVVVSFNSEIENALGGNGRNLIRGNSKSNRIIGGPLDDQLSGQGGADFLSGLGGDDVLQGDDGIDQLAGGLGNDQLFGGADADILMDGRGNDDFYGGPGNDTIRLEFDQSGSFSRVFMQDTDALDFSSVTATLTLDLNNTGIQEVAATHFLQLVDLGGGIGDVFGSSGRNTLIGNDLDNRLIGGNKNDTLIGNGGNDLLDGRGGNDFLDGGANNDILIGGEGDDTHRGGSGDDSLSDGLGEDDMQGGAGNDTYQLNQGNHYSLTLIDDNQGINTLSFASTPLGPGYSTGVVIDLSRIWTAEDLTPGLKTSQGFPLHEISMWYEPHNVIGGMGDDVIVGNHFDNELSGGVGNDRIYGGTGNDILNGGADNDHLYGDYGNDTLFGEQGADFLNGESGDDTLFGGDGEDTLVTGEDRDELFGGGENDTYKFLLSDFGSQTTINDNLGVNLLDFSQVPVDLEVDLAAVGTLQTIARNVNPYFNASHKLLLNDLIHDVQGGRQDNVLLGNSLNNRLSGGPGSDRLEGRGGDDSLFGLASLDRLLGGDGDDFLDGGADHNSDILDGGADFDTALNPAGEETMIAVEDIQFVGATRFEDAISFDHSTGQWWISRSDGTSFTELKGPKWNSQNEWSIFTGDFTGDGVTDLLGRDQYGQFWLAAWNGSSYVTSYWGRFAGSVTNDTLLVGDFNGDGRDDVSGRNHRGEIYVARSIGSQFLMEYWGRIAATGWVTHLVGDFNGDQRQDIAHLNQNGRWWVSQSSSDHFDLDYYAGITSQSIAHWQNILAGDFNGDGIDDVIMQVGTNGQWWIGDGTLAANGSFSIHYANRWDPTAFETFHVGDFNGDGRDDVAGQQLSGHWWINESLSNGRMTSVYWGAWTTSLNWQSAVGDVNGDGRSDIVGLTSTGVWFTLVSQISHATNQFFGFGSSHRELLSVEEIG